MSHLKATCGAEAAAGPSPRHGSTPCFIKLPSPAEVVSDHLRRVTHYGLPSFTYDLESSGTKSICCVHRDQSNPFLKRSPSKSKFRSGCWLLGHSPSVYSTSQAKIVVHYVTRFRFVDLYTKPSAAVYFYGRVNGIVTAVKPCLNLDTTTQ